MTGRLIASALLGSMVSLAAIIQGAELTAQRGSFESVKVSWPGSAAGYLLEQTPILGANAHWQLYPACPPLTDGLFSISVDPDQGGGFYRLRKLRSDAGGNLSDGSLAPSELWRAEWAVPDLASDCPVLRDALWDPVGDYAMHRADYDQAEGERKAKAFVFTAPPGSESFTWIVPMKLPSEEGGGRVRMVLTDLTTTQIVAEVTHLLTPNVANYGLNSQVTAGGEYVAEIEFKNLVVGLDPSRPLVGPSTMACAPGLGVLASSFQRLNVGSNALWSDILNQIRPRALVGSMFSRLVFETDAPRVAIETFSSIAAVSANEATLGVLVNGIEYATLVVTNSPGRAEFFEVSLPPGTNRVEVINGPQERPPGFDLLGTFVRAVYAPAASQLKPTPPGVYARRVIVYGDSIANGASAQPGTLDSPFTAYSVMLRNGFNTDVTVSAWGWRSLRDDNDQGLVQLVGQWTLAQPTDLWLAIGNTDWLLNRWSPADFGQAYASLCDLVHQSLPGAQIWAQTPVPEHRELNPNTYGKVLEDYRQEIRLAAQTRTGWVHLVEGPDILTLADLSDGAHPTQEGNVKWANFIAKVIGLSPYNRP